LMNWFKIDDTIQQ